MKIKFKAITTDGKWVDGFLLPNNIVRQTRKNKDADGRDYDEVISDYKIIPETVCFGVEYDGKWYYENDVVLNLNGSQEIIKFCKFAFLTVDPNHPDLEMLFAPYLFNYEVIGNVHDKHLKG